MANLQPTGLQEQDPPMIEQETTPEQEKALLLERVRSAIRRDADSEAFVLAIRYQKLAHPNVVFTWPLPA